MADPSETFRLTFPATAQFLSLARVNAAVIATELGFAEENVDDLRIAVDEACAVLIQGGGSTHVDLVFATNGTGLIVTGETRGSQLGDLQVDDITSAILHAAVDHHDIEATPHRRWFELRLRRDHHHESEPQPMS